MYETEEMVKVWREGGVDESTFDGESKTSNRSIQMKRACTLDTKYGST